MWLTSDYIINIPNLPVEAADGVEDTKEFYKKDYANFGDDWSDSWKELNLADGTNVKFTNYLNRWDRINAIEWRNLTYCRFISICHCYYVTSIDLSCLKSLRVLIIWYSGIQTVDLTPLSELEMVVCGTYADDFTD